MKKRLLSAAMLLSMLLVLSACLGPVPVLREKHVTPPLAGQAQIYHVEAVIANSGPGDGSVDVVATMRDKQTGATLDGDSKQVQLSGHGEVYVAFDLQLPDSAGNLTPDQVEVDVQAHYPD